MTKLRGLTFSGDIYVLNDHKPHKRLTQKEFEREIYAFRRRVISAINEMGFEHSFKFNIKETENGIPKD